MRTAFCVFCFCVSSRFLFRCFAMLCPSLVFRPPPTQPSRARLPLWWWTEQHIVDNRIQRVCSPAVTVLAVTACTTRAAESNPFLCISLPGFTYCTYEMSSPSVFLHPVHQGLTCGGDRGRPPPLGLGSVDQPLLSHSLLFYFDPPCSPHSLNYRRLPRPPRQGHPICRQAKLPWREMPKAQQVIRASPERLL